MKKIVSIILAALATIGFTVGATGCSEKTQAALEKVGGMITDVVEENGISLKTVAVSADEVSAQAESAYTLTATITPSDAANHGVDWTLAWSDPSSTWASGKTVTDYVTVTTSGSSSKIATVSCLQPFGTQVIITATSQDNPTVKATCTADYVQKVTAASLNIGNINVDLSKGVTNIKYEVSAGVNGPGGVINANVTTSSVYTIAETFTTTVTFDQPGVPEDWFILDGHCPTGFKFMDSSITNWHGKEYYFDYTHDMKNWIIMQDVGDIRFDTLTTAQIIEYMSNITLPNLCMVTLTLTGAHNTYTYSSDIVCTGYTNNTPVRALALDTSAYVF